ncbi:hypothetical protein G6F57_012736 [Rhizopus arrhizus]|nr:hypothetical protein G6F57_012736 [Rhizopus arrhizus]
MVVEHGGFSQAGRALAMPKSTLSRRIALLEERLGVRLIQRSTRRFSVTEVGQDYYRHCKAMLVEAEAAEEAIALSRAEPRGTVRLACPIAILHARIGPMLADFLALHPQVTVQLEATNRRVDVVGEGVDVAIRVRPPPLEDSDLVVRVLARRAWCTSASPALLDQLGTPQVPADLATMPSVDLASPSQQHVWEYTGPGGVQASVHHRPRLVSDDMIALRAAARGAGPWCAGAGVARVGAEARHRARRVPVAARTAAGRAGAARFPGRALRGVGRAIAPASTHGVNLLNVSTRLCLPPVATQPTIHLRTVAITPIIPRSGLGTYVSQCPGAGRAADPRAPCVVSLHRALSRPGQYRGHPAEPVPEGQQRARRSAHPGAAWLSVPDGLSPRAQPQPGRCPRTARDGRVRRRHGRGRPRWRGAGAGPGTAA